MKWIKIQEGCDLPDIGQIVFAYMSIKKEPIVVRYSEDENGSVWTETAPIDPYAAHDRKDLISHWAMYEPPKTD